MRHYFFILLLVVLGVIVVAGSRGGWSQKPPLEIFPDMDRQAKVKAQVPSPFFSDGSGARPPVADTVPMGYAIPAAPAGTAGTAAAITPGSIQSPYGVYSSGPEYVSTGKISGFWGDGIPFPVTPAVMDRGRERYQISCRVCHGGTGAGNGITRSYGFAFVATLLDDRIRQMPDGEIFNTITHGKNTMMSYGDKITVEDRWAIIAYVRALQISQGTPVAELPADMKQTLDTP